MQTGSTVTHLLQQLSSGSEAAADQLIPLIYAELREIASRQMRRERGDHTLQPTALVHEAFLRLVGNNQSTWQNRQHFLGVAAQAMRRTLVDHARRRRAQKRGGNDEKIELDEALLAGSEAPAVDLEALDSALTSLGELDRRQARIVELRFFAGLSVEETAEVLGISPATVKRDWQFAKAWLRREMAD